MHDRGGAPTEARIDRTEHELADWELTMDAIVGALGQNGVMNVDELRRGIESMPREHYESASYYQRWRSLYFVAVYEAEIVGGAGIAPLAGADPLTCELQRMYLRIDARGQGVGTRLLGTCLEAARRFWYVRCYAETIAEMDQALKLYTRNGFVELPGALGATGHAHNDRWLLRGLKPPQEVM